MRRIFFLIVAVIAVSAGPWTAGTALADTLGQSYQYKVNASYDADGATQIQSTLRAIGEHGYFYVDDRYWNSLTVQQQELFNASLLNLSREFDRTIYPQSVQLWGGEATPGVDGDPHVVILLERLTNGSGGYFETIHNYSKERAPEGNAREMIFISAESLLAGAAHNFVAHEFQHLISFQQRELLLNAADDVWLNEARSEYNVTAAGYSEPFEGSTLQRRAQTFVRTPSDSLTQWPNTSTDYAIASLFAHYLIDRFGPALLAHTIHTTYAGTAALEDWLGSVARVHIGDVFSDWMVAVLLNDRSVDPAYGYVRSGLQDVRVRPVYGGQLTAVSAQTSVSVALNEWQPYWTEVDVVAGVSGAGEARVLVSGASDVTWRGSVVAAYRNGAVRVYPYLSSAGVAQVRVPMTLDGFDLVSLRTTTVQGNSRAVLGRSLSVRAVTISTALGDTTVVPNIVETQKLVDGDLIRRQGQQEIYVVWGPYRRFLTSGILELYGFQDRPVREVTDDIFFGYDSSNYIRAIDTQRVYAVWPDDTKHWLNISATQWNGSGRDWGAIFTVNDAEVAHYSTGVDITR